MPEIRIELRQRDYYFRDSVKLPYRGGRDFKARLGSLANEKGVYVIYARKGNAAYVGQTSGDKTNFGIRLFRHSSRKAAGSNRTVHRWLFRNRDCAKATLLPYAKVLQHFARNTTQPRERMAALLLEQALVCYLHPSLQKKCWR